MTAMQVLTPSRPTRASGTTSSAFGGLLVGGTLVLGALLVGYLAFGTSPMQRLTPAGRPDTSHILLGMLVWAMALAAPAAFGLVGIARVLASIEVLRGLRGHVTPAARHRRALSDDIVVAPRVVLPDGRVVNEVVFGPFGIAVIGELPPRGAYRQRAQAWVVRLPDGRWRPIESPLERAARDAESVRRWVAHDDRDFVVKAYAAVAGPAGSGLSRTPSGAMLSFDQVPAWLGGLPAQRTLTPSRIERVVELVGAAI
jgi:hypothetical protein